MAASEVVGPLSRWAWEGSESPAQIFCGAARRESAAASRAVMGASGRSTPQDERRRCGGNRGDCGQGRGMGAAGDNGMAGNRNVSGRLRRTSLPARVPSRPPRSRPQLQKRRPRADCWATPPGASTPRTSRAARPMSGGLREAPVPAPPLPPPHRPLASVLGRRGPLRARAPHRAGPSLWTRPTEPLVPTQPPDVLKMEAAGAAA
ncbi:hypothetical protein H8959_011927 [Pygathrix nigripes]